MSADEPIPHDVAKLSRQLASEMRRIINSLVLARPPAEELALAVERARGFADRLEALPQRSADGEISEAGLGPRRFVDHSPVSGRWNALAPPVRMRAVEEESGRVIEGEVTFGAAYEGPPGHVHGGYVAAMFDELLGFAQFSPGFTASLKVNYRRPTPLARTLSLRGWVESTEGRKRIVKGTCHLDGELLSDAEGLFLMPKGDMAEWLSRFS